MGISCVGRKGVTCPDLIWTLSCRRSPGLGSLGPHQATNFFGASSSCLTTKVRHGILLPQTRRYFRGAYRGKLVAVG